MSQDLFAAFSDAPTGTQSKHAYVDDSVTGTVWREAFSSELTSAAPPQIGNDRDLDEAGFEDDDFGDFEDASVNAPAPAPAPSSPAPPTEQVKQEVPKKSQKDSLANSTVAWKKPETNSHPFAGHMDILFADDDGEYDAGQDDWGDISKNPEAAMALSKKLIKEQEERRTHDFTKPPVKSSPVVQRASNERNSIASKATHQTESRPKPPNSKNPDVLFDFDNVSDHESDNGDFGDFESYEPPEPTTSNSKATLPVDSMPSLDLLGFDDSPKPPTKHSSVATKQPRQPSPSPKRTLTKASTKAAPPAVFAQPDDNDAWDDFEEASPAATAAPPHPQVETIASPMTRSSISSMAKTRSGNTTDMLPPTNIPPPLLLLSIFPREFSSADTTLFGPLSKLPAEQRQLLLSHSATHQFLRGYLDLATVLGHIIAGRKHRWKRDQILAQSMRMGPAAAGGKGGMKLAGVDRSEAAKEDREVVDTLRLWKTQVGKLRGAVTGANAAGAKLPAVPDIAETVPVRALKPADGGIVASHACALCGLKREERAAKVDMAVDDSFGEWWVQGTNMHVICLKFWEAKKSSLRSR